MTRKKMNKVNKRHFQSMSVDILQQCLILYNYFYILTLDIINIYFVKTLFLDLINIIPIYQ